MNSPHKIVGVVVAVVAAVMLVAVLTVAGLQGVVTALAGGSPSGAARADIPADYLRLYQQAATDCPGLDWALLAAIGKTESDHGRDPAPGVTTGHNGAGAAVISGSALVSRHVRVVGDTPHAGEVSAGYES